MLRDDLIAAGMVGLWDAITRTKDLKTFEWYARVRIRGAIQDELREQDILQRRARKRVQAADVAAPRFVPLEAASGFAFDKSPPADESLAIKARMSALRLAIGELSKREQKLILFTLNGESPTSMAKRMRVSQARITQLRDQLVIRIQRSPHMQGFVDEPMTPKLRWRPASRGKR